VRTLTYNRLAVPVHEHLLRTTDLLAHGIVDRVTGPLLGSADLAPLARNRLSTAASQCSLAAGRLSSPNGLFPLGDFPKSARRQRDHRLPVPSANICGTSPSQL
jgi:hypothetical protein